jgi:hypothetical protein
MPVQARITIGDEDPRGFRQPIPPSEVIEHDAIRAAAERFESASAKAHEARVTLTDMEQRRPAADEADRQAYAEAIEKGEKDPGRRHGERADRAIEQARRTAEALSLVAERALDAFREAVYAGQEQWHTTALGNRDAARAKLAEQLDAVADTLNELARHEAMERYTSGRGGRLDLPRDTIEAKPLDRRAMERSGVNLPMALGVLYLRAVPAPPTPPRTYIEPDGQEHEVVPGSGALRELTHR